MTFLLLLTKKVLVRRNKKQNKPGSAQESTGAISTISHRIKRQQNPKVRMFGEARSTQLEVLQGQAS